ncbi:hypothetical protein FG379_001093 [Cryptosporidium bovis]|uniref:uncharacterized protein n=1 Tax=Cryptosporidium bovis TaxID=310047 RepID=UPI00351A1822|nr:hypothetical protein FG379_001093 [Cryptosporidium bovis]
MEVENSSPNQYTSNTTAAKNEQTANKRPSDANTEDQPKKACSDVTNGATFTNSDESVTSGIITSTTTTNTTASGTTNTFTTLGTTTTTKSDNKSTQGTTGSTEGKGVVLTNVTTKGTTSYEMNKTTGEKSVATETQITFSNLGIQVQKTVEKITTYSASKKQEATTDCNEEKVVQTTKITSTEIKSSIDSMNTNDTTAAQLCCYFDAQNNTMTYIDTIPSKIQTTTTVVETLHKGVLTSRETETETIRVGTQDTQTTDAQSQGGLQGQAKNQTQGQAGTQTQTHSKFQVQGQVQSQAQSQAQTQAQAQVATQAQMEMQSQVKTQEECQSETNYQLEQTMDETGEFGIKSAITQFGKTTTKTTETYNEDGSGIVKKEQTNGDGTKIVTVTTTTKKASCSDNTKTGKDMCYTGTTTKEYYSFDGTQKKKTQQIFDKTITVAATGCDDKTTVTTTKVDGVTGDCEMTTKKETIIEKGGKVVGVTIEQTFGNGKKVTTTVSTDNTSNDFVERYVSSQNKSSAIQTAEQATFDSMCEFTTSNHSKVVVVTTDKESMEVYRKEYETNMYSSYTKSSGNAENVNTNLKATEGSEIGCSQMSKNSQESNRMSSANTLAKSKAKTQTQTQNQNVSQN